MIPPLPWVQAYRQGFKHLRSLEYEMALRSFDESVELGGSQVKILPSRSEVLQSLRSLELSFLVEEEGVKSSTSMSGVEEVRSSRLFSILARLPPPIRTLLLNPSASTSFNDIFSLAHQESLESLLPDLRTHSPRNLIDYVPAEVLTLIGRQVCHDRGIDASFQLAGVSRRWRAIFIADAELWGRIELFRKDGPRKLECLLEKGPPRSVRVERHVEERVVDLVFEALKWNVASLTSLDIHLTTEHGLEDVWMLSSAPLALTELKVNRNSRSDPPQIPLPLHFGHISSLLRLTLTFFNPTVDSSLYPLLQHIPHLQTLKLQFCNLSFDSPTASPSSPTIISLPNLLRIESEGSTIQFADSTVFLLPRLEASVHWEAAPFDFNVVLFPPAPHPPNIAHLEELVVVFGWELEPDLASILERLKEMRSLVKLNISSLFLADNALIDALVWKGDEDANFCPFLRELDFGVASGEDLIRLVKSRWEGWKRGECEKLVELQGDETSEGLREQDLLLLRTMVQVTSG